MLAATALAAVLMATVLHVIASIGRSRSAMERGANRSAAPWKADLLDSLRWDLHNAQSVKFDRGRVTLAGHGALDPATLAPGHEPVTVTYELDEIAGRTWLVRRQAPRDAPAASSGRSRRRAAAGTAGGWSELVCPDVTAFAVDPVEPVRTRREWSPERRPAGMPQSLWVRVEGAGGVIIDEIVVLR